MSEKLYAIELPSGRTIPMYGTDEQHAKKNFHEKYPHKTISYVWDW